ncbi:hypothetical protein HRW18_04010 [Streptomyces lunaelactis]|uniref:hypothetical protein n=1 Tax=Streptomyces lunaelactis TaxID=1535768 RepID=UPI0015853AEC|nr:hypothetical protein [Streptomyces lunaelactis]NUK07190.1 hypothetical protein [Streptomyces lunaelactis]NUL08913.1 hypothetical protein [Streptomyces lunaelactis]NUL21770.1 hypothetical protein [Streptomyces lunaelactis]
MLDLDRGWIRQALAILYRSGLVGQKPGQGVWIWPVSTDRLQRITFLRHEIETLAAASIISASPLRDISQLALRHEECTAAHMPGHPFEVDTFLTEDTNFHAEIARVGGYPLGAETVRNWGRHARIFFAVPEQHHLLLGGYVPLAATTEKIFELLKIRSAEASTFMETYFNAWRDLIRIEIEDGTLSMEDAATELELMMSRRAVGFDWLAAERREFREGLRAAGAASKAPIPDRNGLGHKEG